MIKSRTDFVQGVKNILHNGTAKVVFTKADGTEWRSFRIDSVKSCIPVTL